MELYHLRSFVAVAQTGNLTQAAKRLYTTPPALSAHIKALEAELATELFARSSKGMTLTDKGKLLLEKAQATLDSAVDLVNLAATNQNELIGTFTIGLNTSAKSLKLADLLDNLNQNCPGISLEVNQQSSGKIIEAIKNNTLDGGYIFADDSIDISNEFLSLKIVKQRITTIAPTDLRISEDPNINELKTLPWITMTNYCPFDNYLAAKLGNNLTSTVKSSDDSTRLELVKNGVGLSFLEYGEAEKAEQNQQVKMIDVLDFDADIYFIVNKVKTEEPVIKAVLNEIKKLWSA